LTHIPFRPVLMVGEVNRKSSAQVMSEIANSDHHRVTLVIKSDGGEIDSALELIRKINHWRNDVTIQRAVSVHIYEAKSVAAVIALSIAEPEDIAIHTEGTIAFHRGTLILEYSDYDLETGVIRTEVLDVMKTYREMLWNILERHSLDKDSNLMAEFFGSNWLRFDAKACLAHGLAGTIFSGNPQPYGSP